MKFSEAWLREWVDIELDSVMLSHQIAMAGLEVNAIKPVARSFKGIVVGKIVKCKKYQSVNNLYLAKVDIGKNRILNIICNAPNCRIGIKVAVAPTDVVLLNSLETKKVKYTGELSDGILYSPYELGISEENSSIIELPNDAPIGIDVREYMKLDDNTIDISIPPNRSDCFSVIGIAREVSMFNRARLKKIKIVPIEIGIHDTFPVKIEAPDACPRYLSRIIKNANVRAITPLWMKEKLRRCGIYSTDIISDITNYVLLELGQPVHVFDRDRIKSGIIVRMAKEKETIFLFDGREVKLNTDTLVVADYNKVLEIAGISGSMYSGIRSDTHSLLLECAFFSPFAIVGRARYYGIYTNASYRYERGIDPSLQHAAMERVSRLILDICGGKAGLVSDVTYEKMLPKCKAITLRRVKIDRLLGYSITNEKIKDILHRVGCEVSEGDGEWRVIAPSWRRFDMEIEEDLIEEIARIYGYAGFPEKPLQINLKMSNHKETDLSLKRVKSMLNDKGYQEVITYSFVNPKLQQLIHPGEEAVVLPNPISKDMSAMRLSLWSGLLSTVIYNQNRQQNRIRIFEAGFRFVPDIRVNLGVRQDFMLAGAISGNLYENHWDLEKREIDFYDIKGDIESILDLTGKLSEIRFRVQSIPALHTGQSAAIYLYEKCIGFIGIIHPELRKKINLNICTAVFELEWSKISNRAITKIQKISLFPANRRDIAVVVSENVSAEDILEKCKKVCANYAADVHLFDVYRGKGIEKGYKSLAISLLLQDTNRTLKEEEIMSIVVKCAEALKKKFQASLRDNLHPLLKK